MTSEEKSIQSTLVPCISCTKTPVPDDPAIALKKIIVQGVRATT